MSALSTRLIAWLNGTDSPHGHPITDEGFRLELALGDLCNVVATLDGTDSGEGTDLIGVPDANSHFTASTLSGVLDELYTAATTASSDTFTDGANWYATDTVGAAFQALAVALGGTNSTTRTYTGGTGRRIDPNDTFFTAVNKLDQGFVDLQSTANAKGLGMVGVEDAAGWYSSSVGEGALVELKTAIGGATSTTRAYSSTGFLANNDTLVVALGKLDAALSAVVAENADGIIPIHILGGFTAITDSWTPARAGTATYRLRRAAANAVVAPSLALVVPMMQLRTSANKGRKITGIKVQYEITTADINDVTFEGNYAITPATGNAIAAATSLGAVSYDSAHDTAAERKTMGNHTAIVTFATPTYLMDGLIELLVNVDGTATGVLDIKQVSLITSETLVDGS